MNEFKDMFRYLRKREGFTQVELAEGLGLSKGMIPYAPPEKVRIFGLFSFRVHFSCALGFKLI